jgi:threonine/homoserine/homoserine lactone efflux protein
MTWARYGSFVVFATLLTLAPGPDFAVVTRNALVHGKRRGVWASLGVTSSNAVQGLVAAVGLGALIVASHPVFEAIRWAGVGYLFLLGIFAIRSAVRGEYAPVEEAVATDRAAVRASARAGWRQGFLSNITNPKVLVFYLSVLPQFLPSHPTVVTILALAFTHAVIGLVYLLLLVTGLDRVRRVLVRRRVRRALDATTGAVLFAFGARLASESG